MRYPVILVAIACLTTTSAEAAESVIAIGGSL